MSPLVSLNAGAITFSYGVQAWTGAGSTIDSVASGAEPYLSLFDAGAAIFFAFHVLRHYVLSGQRVQFVYRFLL